ncbi:hypothetical protein F5887DRAFT_1004090, partial [Amanita rubescens]
QLQSSDQKCNNCRAMKKTVLCSYAVDTSMPPMEWRGCCNHCFKLHKVCGSSFFPYAQAVSLPLPPIPQHPSSKRDSSYIESDDDNEHVSESSTPPQRTNIKRRRGRPPKRVERNDEVVRRQPETVPSKRKFQRCKTPVQGSTSTQRTSAVSSDIRAPTGRGPGKSAIQPPVSQFQTPQASARAEIFQILRDIGTSIRRFEQDITTDVRRIEDIMRTYPPDV